MEILKAHTMQKTSQQIKFEFNNRLSMFQEGYTFEECDGLVRSLGFVGKLLTLAFDPVAAGRGMKALQYIITKQPTEEIEWSKLTQSDEQSAWEDDWKDLDAFNDTYWSDTMERAHNLNAFAYYGILPTWDSKHVSPEMEEIADVTGYIRRTVEQLTKFTSLLPKEHDSYGIDAIERTCLASDARLKIDSNDSVTVHELAALTGVTTKRLQNAIYAKSEDAPIPGKDGLISTESAQRWLRARDYLPSIWQEFVSGRCWEVQSLAGAVHHDVGEVASKEEFLFVPEAKDGTIFGPTSCLRPGHSSESPHYTVGAKGVEQDFDN